VTVVSGEQLVGPAAVNNAASGLKLANPFKLRKRSRKRGQSKKVTNQTHEYVNFPKPLSRNAGSLVTFE